jgi:hypothetical protein
MVGKGGVKDAGPDAGVLDRPLHGDKCAGKAGPPPPISTGYRFPDLWMPANCRSILSIDHAFTLHPS